jgi:hypothetical protein
LLRTVCAFAAIDVLPYSLAISYSKFEDKTTAECLKEEACQQAILNRVETRMGGLDYQAGFPTLETVERLYDEMDYQRAVLAHQISDNLVSFYSMHTGVLEVNRLTCTLTGQFAINDTIHRNMIKIAGGKQC